MKKSYTISDFYEFYLSYIERETVYDVDYKTSYTVSLSI